MKFIGKQKLIKLKRKNKGNRSLSTEIEKLIKNIEDNNWVNHAELKAKRNDADCVHNDGFYFFNIEIHRTMILIEFEDNGEATFVWAGTHQEYEKTFKNNKNAIKRWLKINNWI